MNEVYCKYNTLDKIYMEVFKDLYNYCMNNNLNYFQYESIFYNLIQDYTKNNLIRWCCSESDEIKFAIIHKSFLWMEYDSKRFYKECILTSNRIVSNSNNDKSYLFKIFFPSFDSIDILNNCNTKGLVYMIQYEYNKDVITKKLKYDFESYNDRKYSFIDKITYIRILKRYSDDFFKKEEIERRNGRDANKFFNDIEDDITNECE